TEEDFRASEELLRRVGFNQSFVFKYSPRPDTPAVKLEDDVPEVEKNRRCNALLDVQAEIALAQHNTRVGSTVQVLVDGASKNSASRFAGRSPDNRIVVFEGPVAEGSLAQVRITRASATTLYGDLVRPRVLPVVT